MKKIVALIVLICITFSGCGVFGGTLSKKLTAEDVAYTPHILDLPDLSLFVGSAATQLHEAEEDSYEGSQNIGIDKDSEKAVLEYIDLLQSEFGLEIIDTAYFDPATKTFENFIDKRWVIGFKTTRFDAQCRLTHSNIDKGCDVILYQTNDTLYLNYYNMFNLTDTGHRYSEIVETFDFSYPDRFFDAYAKSGNKYYNKGDKKLTVNLKHTDYTITKNSEDYAATAGSVTMLFNGEKAKGTAKLQNSKYSDWFRYVITITDFDKNKVDEEIRVYLPIDTISGDFYNTSDCLSGHQDEIEMNSYGVFYKEDYLAEDIGLYYYIEPEGYAYSVSVRAISFDDSGKDDCVVYFNIKLYNMLEPLEIEGLAVMPLNDYINLEATAKTEKKSSGGIFSIGTSSKFQPEFSKLDCLTCGGDGDCNTCRGYGEVERYAGAGDTVTSKCSSCYGSGNCRTCGGSGKRD